MATDIPTLGLFSEFVTTRDGRRADGAGTRGGLPFLEGPSLQRDIEGLLGDLRSGELEVDPLERQSVLGIQCSAMEAVMLDCLTTERFQSLRPVLEWLYTEKGMSPWDDREREDGQPMCGYDWLIFVESQEYKRDEGILQWCWDLPDAPKPWVGNARDQIAHDQLRETVRRHEPMDPRIVQQMDKAGLVPLKAWPNGLRPVDMLLEHALPWNDCDEYGIPWEGAGPDGRERARKAHEWVHVIRNISRVGLSLLDASPVLDDDRMGDVFHVRALLWAHALQAFKSFGAEDPVAATLRNFDRKLGRALKLGLKGPDLHEDLHEKTRAWFSSQPPSYDMARLALQMEIAYGVEKPPGVKDKGVGEKVGGKKADPVAVAEGMLTAAGLLGDSFMDLGPHEKRGRRKVAPWEPWETAWAAVAYACMMKDSPVLDQVKKDPNVWALALPALSQAIICPGKEFMLQALDAGNHPNLDPAFSQASAWESILLEKRGDPGWDRRVEAALLARKMDKVLPPSSDPDEMPAPRPRF